MTKEGQGAIIETRPLRAEVKVKLNDNEKDAGKFYKIADVKVLSRPEKKKGKPQENDAEDTDIIED
jgi:hypothetical protein